MKIKHVKSFEIGLDKEHSPKKGIIDLKNMFLKNHLLCYAAS